MQEMYRAEGSNRFYGTFHKRNKFRLYNIIQAYGF